jgi:hypothetical protein
MSVLEICQLRIKDGLSTDDPSVLQSLIEVRSMLKSKITNTNSRFYQCIEDPTLIYIFGVWPSVSSHENFRSSPARPEILAPQEDVLDFGWITHMPLPGMESLPLDAPVMSLARFFVKGGDDHVEFQKVLDKSRAKIVDATRPYTVVDGWSCDAEPGKHEALVFTGWASTKDHEEITAEAVLLDPEYGTVRMLSDGFEVKIMSDMEA